MKKTEKRGPTPRENLLEVELYRCERGALATPAYTYDHECPATEQKRGVLRQEKSSWRLNYIDARGVHWLPLRIHTTTSVAPQSDDARQS
jgi:hypothetical protein